ncbi:MAG: aa3-type cytochrome c oxidase subunit IV [Parvibaculales bacterium]
MIDENPNQQWGNEMDRGEHENTYAGFIRYSTWVIVASAISLLLLLIFVYD